ncbi:nicotinamide-nucleotide amidase [Singulisphaera sp. GP187]|uniref:competence/damage-inducible protein A n=1 Tax=Singulisphaera sp. GP187 TaxID=1882752 RepID=UPI00092C115F|nr:competence/damage-inducible protein A [Singulisphaera sp. GP187]SIO67525.1 nicotinamide-nucleotide amidase [Singulisphaera sp. GP187]
MKAEIIAIGSELVSGQCLDTNSQWLSRELGSLGIPVHFHTTLGDDIDEDVAAFQIAIAHADLILVSGGLGPTQDDLTREALARVAGVPLVENAEALAAIAAMFARRSRPMAERNRVQALFPLGAEMIPNRVGTAPGIWMKVGNAVVACLPGVPSELRVMYDEQVRPRLNQFALGGRVILHHKINLFGRGESDVEAAALDLTARGRVPEVGITAHDATISFRISAEGTTEDEARRAMEPTLDLIRTRFVELIVGEGTDDVAEALLAQLVRTGATVATAESCTGGLVAQMITAQPGVSAYFPGGVVSYSNQAKQELLGVPASLVATHGAVSAEVAEAMATGVRDRFHATLGLSVTGVAGPTGGTPEKPVGLVFLGLATPDGKVQTRKLEIGPEQPREIIQRRSAKHALNWARLALLPMPSREIP